MSRRCLLSFVIVMFGLLAFASSSRAGMAVLQQSVTVDRAAGAATFTVDFQHPPDFFTVDKAGRPADSFEIDIAANSSGPGSPAFGDLTTIVRGAEIHVADTLPVRNAFPPASDPNSGGWGSVRGTVPFSVSGDTLTFTAPLKLLGAPNGQFSYLAFTTHFASEVSASQGESVPLPSAFTAGMLMIGIGILLSMCKPRIAIRVRG